MNDSKKRALDSVERMKLTRYRNIDINDIINTFERRTKLDIINEYKKELIKKMNNISEEEGHDTCCGMTLNEFIEDLGLKG